MVECFIYEFDPYTKAEAIKVRERGGFVENSDNNLIASLIDLAIDVESEDFVVAGAFIEGCIPSLIGKLFLLNAKSVKVEVDRCRSVSEVISGNNLSIEERIILIKTLLKEEINDLDGTRLLFITSKSA